jgi:hypothetical protein
VAPNVRTRTMPRSPKGQMRRASFQLAHAHSSPKVVAGGSADEELTSKFR